MGKITAAITGVCGYLPEEVVTNEDLAKSLIHLMNGLLHEQVSKKDES